MSKNKILIIVASILVIVIVGLVIVITNINKDDEDEIANSNLEKITESIQGGTEKNKTSSIDADNNFASEPVVTNELSNEDLSNKEKKDETVPITKEIKVNLGEYKGIKAEYSPIIITDEDIENNLNRLKDEYTVLVNLPDRAFDEGDMAIVSYVGKVDGKEIGGLEVVYLQVVLGEGLIPAVIEENIIGKRIGDVFDVEIDYPSDYTYLNEIAGKTVVFTVELADGFEFYVPEINDSFIRDYTEYDSVTAYKSKEKQRLQEEQDGIARKNTENEIKHKLVDSCSFEGDIDNEIKKTYVLLLDQENSELMDSYWMDAETYYQLMYDYEPGEYTKQLMESVTYDIKYTYILDEIVKRENLQVTNEEFEKYLTETYMVENGYRSKEALYADISEDKVKEEVNTQILRNKASNLVYDLAEISSNN